MGKSELTVDGLISELKIISEMGYGNLTIDFLCECSYSGAGLIEGWDLNCIGCNLPNYKRHCEKCDKAKEGAGRWITLHTDDM